MPITQPTTRFHTVCMVLLAFMGIGGTTMVYAGEPVYAHNGGFVSDEVTTLREQQHTDGLANVAGDARSQPLPRFVAIKKLTNLHVGPGQQYPTIWQYVVPFFPMEVIAESGHWRQVRDFQGTRGWVHKSLLTARRHVLAMNQIQDMYDAPSVQGRVVARLSPGVIGRILQIQGMWCKVCVEWNERSYKGWVERRHVWGLYPHETHF